MLTGAAAGAILIAGGIVVAGPPPANTSIGNQAAGSYLEGGERVTIQSNPVETRVKELYDIDVQEDTTRSGVPGGFVYFPHTVSNNGNTDDIFDLSVASTTGNATYVIYPDADGDGVPDNLTPITVTPSVNPGETFNFIVAAQLPTNATASTFSVTGTSQADPLVTDTVNDAITITTGGLIDLAKDQSLQNDADGDGVPSVGDTILVEITYSNVGIADSTNVTIEDILATTNENGDPVTLTYVTGSGLWSDTGATGLTDIADSGATATDPFEATNAQGESIDYQFDAANNTIDVIFDVVKPGRSGTVSFEYEITAAPAGDIGNTATVETDDQTETPSNTSIVNVEPTVGFTLADAEADAYAGPAVGDDTDAGNLLSTGDDPTAVQSGTDDDGALDDIVTDSDDIYPGGRSEFEFVLTNHSGASDTISLNVQNTDFPAGTTFDLVYADGITPIVGNQIVLGSGEVTTVRVVARIPGSTAPTATTDYDAVLTGTSVSDPSVQNASELSFTGALLAPPVDLVNTDGSGNVTGGTGPNVSDPAGDPWSTQAGDPGEELKFPLQVVVAAGSAPNSFDFSASADETFASLSLPPGYQVVFTDVNGNVITGTGTMTPTATDDAVFEYFACVILPEDAEADDVPTDLYFRVESPLNGATDTINNALTVNEIVDLEIGGSASVQAAPGGVVTIPHTITNNGNSTVTAGALNINGTGPADDSDGISDDPFSDSGTAAALYYDANGDGVLGSGDPLITDISDIPGGIPAGDQVRIFVRAQVPSTATSGIIETGDVAVDPNLTTVNGAATDTDLTNNEVLDTITIITGDLTLTKVQALDEDCDGAADGPFGAAIVEALPGECLIYQVTADNSGSGSAADVLISDVIPNWTTYEECSGTCAAVFTVDGGANQTPVVLPADGDRGTVATGVIGGGVSLEPGSRMILTFSVEIDS